MVEARHAAPLQTIYQQEDITQDENQNQSLFPEITYRIPAMLAVTTKAAVPHCGKLLPPDGFTGQNTGQDKVKHGNFMKHAAGR